MGPSGLYIYIIYIYVTCVTNHLQSPRNRRRVDSRPAATFAQRRLAVPKTRSVGWLGCKLSSCPLLCLPTGCSILCHLWLMCRACDTSAGDFSPPLTRESWKLLGGLEIVNLHFFLPYTQVIAFFFSPFNMFSSGNHDQSSNWGVPSFQTLLGVQGHSNTRTRGNCKRKASPVWARGWWTCEKLGCWWKLLTKNGQLPSKKCYDGLGSQQKSQKWAIPYKPHKSL